MISQGTAQSGVLAVGEDVAANVDERQGVRFEQFRGGRELFIGGTRVKPSARTCRSPTSPDWSQEPSCQRVCFGTKRSQVQILSPRPAKTLVNERSTRLARGALARCLTNPKMDLIRVPGLRRRVRG